jgi:tetratricopeptide (TPR) repeat protein
VGCSADSTNYINLVKRLLEEIKLEFGLEEPIPGDKEELINSLPGFLAKTNVLGKRWVLIIDGINQLENEDNALLMNWLPVIFHAQIRVIFSVLPGIALDSLIRRDYILFKVPILNEIYREKLVREYLPVYGKNLRDEQFRAIAYSEMFQNPLILISFLEELRIFGSHLQLNSFLSGFVKLGNIERFFEQILSRIENDFSFNESINAGYIFSLIWASRKGLSENEIIEISRIRPIVWSQLYLAADFHLINKGGKIGFSHDYFRQAVERKFLNDQKFKIRIANIQTTHFLQDQFSSRSMEELPHLWTIINDYENLANYLTNPIVYIKLFERDKIDFIRFCIPLRNLPDFEDQFVFNWEKSRLSRENYFETGLKTTTILSELGYNKQSLIILKKILKYAKKKEIPKEKLEQLYFMMGKAFWNHGEYINAIKYYKECYNIRSKFLGKGHIQCGDVLTQLGLSYQWSGRMVEAEEMYIKAHKIWLKHKMYHSSQIATSYTYLGILNYDLGKYKKSISLYSKSIALSFLLFGNLHPMISENFNDIGLAYLDLGEIDKAKEYFDKSLEINLALLGSDHPTTLTDYNNIAYYYMLKGNVASALEYNHITLNSCRKYYSDNNMETTYSYTNIGANYGVLNEWEKALQNYQKSLDICKKQVGLDNEETGSAMQLVGAMYCEIGEYKKAKDCLENSLYILQRYLKSSNPVIASVNNDLGKLYLAIGKKEQSIECFRKSLNILKKSPGINTIEYANTLDNIGKYNISINNLQDAEKFLTNSLKIKTKRFGKQHYEVANTLCILAEYHKKNNQPNESKKSLQQAIEIYRLLNFEKLFMITKKKINEFNC